VWRPAEGAWLIRLSGGGERRERWGGPGDVPVPADHDGDGRADLAVFGSASAVWRIQRSHDRGETQVAWGAPALGDVPVTAPSERAAALFRSG
jgi:hypothetical protein